MPMPEQRTCNAASMILGQLLAGAATAREIRDGTGLPAPTVKDRLAVLVRAGSVAKTPNGRAPRYHLTAATNAAGLVGSVV
jgi:DNA-binding IclR family transcriptional regulator